MILPPYQPLVTPAATSRVKVCIVDTDFGDYQPLLSERSLRGVGWEMISSGREALRELQSSAITLWVVQVHLPDMSGTDLCQMIKAHSPTAVVYLVTDEYSAADERAAWQAGAALFRPKPIDPAWFEPIARRRWPAKAM